MQIPVDPAANNTLILATITGSEGSTPQQKHRQLINFLLNRHLSNQIQSSFFDLRFARKQQG